VPARLPLGNGDRLSSPRGQRFIVVTSSLLAFFLLAASPILAARDPASDAGLEKLASDSLSPLLVRRDPGGPRFFLSGRVPFVRFSRAATAAARSEDFWKTYGAAFGIAEPENELELRSSTTDRLGMTHLRYDQRYRGLPVFGRQLVLHLDASAIVAVNGEFSPGITVRATPGLSAEEALEAAVAGLSRRASRPGRTTPELLVFVDASERPHLAWLATVVTERPFGFWRVFVDAETGGVLFSYDDLKTARNRMTYTNGNDPDCNTEIAPLCLLPGTLVRTEAGPTSADVVVNAAHDNAGTVYNYFQATFGRDSYDGAGHSIRSTVRFGAGYLNAFWCSDACAVSYGSVVDGEQMAYGDGDGVTVGPFALALDVVAHELTHAVTDSTADLIYDGQSGALNESYSDVFGAMVDTGDWLLGEDVFTPGVPGDAIRSMADPTLFGQPEHMSEYFHTFDDNRGVHTNSGIPNKAAYLAATDPTYGVGRSFVEQIYYRALTFYLTPSSDFLTNLNALRQAATDLYGAGSAQARAVVRAHAAVGIANPPSVTFPNGGESLARGVPATILWNTGGDAGLSSRVESLRDLGAAPYSQNFEAAALPPEFATAGNAPWFPDTFQPGSGTRSAGSGVIPNGGRSELSLVATMTAAGNVTFLLRVSSELDFDFFGFYVDGVLRLSGSGNIPWQPVSVSLSVGTHRFVWVYEKDGSVSAGFDAAWIDDLVIPNAENVAVATINAATTPGASSQSWTPVTAATNYRVRVGHLGVAPWLASDRSDALFAVVEPADLSISKTDLADPVSPGASLSYSLAVSNAGPAVASGVTVTDALPSGTAFVSATGTGWTCGVSLGTVTCTRASLSVGPAPLISLAVTVPSAPGVLSNTASVSAAEPDPVTGNNSSTATTTVSGTPIGRGFHTATPCRVLDTRSANGPFGGPALSATLERVFMIAGQCGIPTSAKSVSFNVTVTAPTADGHLSLYPGGTPLPLVSSINYRVGQTRANNAIMDLGAGGTLAVFCGQGTGTVHFIVDVNGWFE